ncbi:hypothetical protein KTD17_11735 [Burkholderia multivorans]|uniref:hypothetical protein n=1 Tax=Burkholderia multivorans TaxID=87883 RepID=UPI001C21A2D0|nr:hypothetical protein [Burkholderia multivorans]MBU9133659.1 hypothetical protein [Burkholderia multivorans]
MPTQNDMVEVLRLAEKAGVKLVVQFRAPDGWMECPITPEVLARCIASARSVPAAAVGVSDAEYAEWVENNGAVQCIAKTRAGKRCRCFVPGAHYRNALAWKEANDAGGYCSVHGGA